MCEKLFQKIKIVSFLSLLSLVFTHLGHAKVKPKTPEVPEGFTRIDVQKAKELHGKGLTFVDVRKKLEFKEEHISGAVHIPYKEKSQKVKDYDMGKDKFKHGKLPANDKGYVFYCNGATCWKSYKASAWAHKNGVKNVYWLRDGFPGWKKAGYSVEK